MKKFLIYITALFGIFALAEDYCKIDCGGQPHVGCNNSMTFGAACGSGASIVDFTPTLIDIVTNKHNFYRNMVAGGNLANFSPAAKMATIRWHPELAKLAQWNAMKCIMRHDCHNTIEFKYSGQNLFMFMTTGTINVRDALDNGMNMWFSEYKYANMTYINKYPSKTSSVIGHFTVMIAEKNTHVGCGATIFHSAGKNYFLLACNYATTNIIGWPVYTTGVPTSNCNNTLPNPLYPNLCY